MSILAVLIDSGYGKGEMMLAARDRGDEGALNGLLSFQFGGRNYFVGYSLRSL